MDEQRLAEFIGSQAGQSVDVRSARRVALGPLRTVFDVDTSVGRFKVHIKVDGSPGATPETEFTLMNTLADAGVPVARPRWSEPTGAVLDRGRARLLTRDVLHVTAGTVDVDRDVGVGVLRFQVQKLGDDQVRDVVVDRRAEEDDAIDEQP